MAKRVSKFEIQFYYEVLLVSNFYLYIYICMYVCMYVRIMIYVYNSPELKTDYGSNCEEVN